MAKGIEMNGQLRGKRGGVVYYRADGQQISRSRNFNPKNPKTEKQQIQRMIMATCMQAYSAMAEICDHSWEGVPYVGRSMNKFLSLNARKLRSALGTEENDVRLVAPGIQTIVPNEFAISRGSLEPIEVLSPDDVVFAFGKGVADPDHDTLAELTVFDLLETFGASAGDMVTICLVNKSETSLYSDGIEGFVHNVFSSRFEYYRIKFAETIDITAAKTATCFTNGKLDVSDTDYFVPAESASEFPTFSLVDISGRGAPTLAIAYAAGLPFGYYAACGVIRSRFQNNVWRRSNADLVIGDASNWGLEFGIALDAWKKQTTDLGTGDWLLNDKETAGF